MEKVEFYRHALEEEDIDAVGDVLRGIFLTTGPRTAEFERTLAAYLGVKFVVGVSSCTDALFLSLKALGVGEGDEVLTTPMTFIASANAVMHAGATPVFVDVEPATGNIDVNQIQKALTARTKAVIPVHLYGTMVDVRNLYEICRRNNLLVVEDAAHALEATRDGVRPGQLSSTACFSFYATKNLTCGEGGAVATNDAELNEKLRWLRLHGMSKNAAERYTGNYQHWDMVGLGYKANMFDVQAALLLGQIPRLAKQLDRREAIARRYEDAFAGMKHVTFPAVPRGATSARYIFTIWVPPQCRDDALLQLQRRGIGVAVNFRAIHLLSYYRQRFGFKRGDFPVAEQIGDSTITLPLYPKMRDEEVNTVIQAVREIVD